MSICGIYKIANKINGKCYIGQSIDIKRRWRQHKEIYVNPTAEGYDYPLYKAIRFYGLENFSFEVLEEFGVSDRVIRAINTGKEFPVSGIEYPLRKPFSVCSGKITCQPHTCPICGTMTKNKTYCSPKCSQEGQKKIKHPSREELKNLIRDTPFTVIGKQFSVSDTSITKWCKSYNLPFRRRDINSISDEDWVNI